MIRIKLTRSNSLFRISTSCLVILFNTIFITNSKSQDALDLSYYFHAPNGDAYLSAINSLRIQENNIRKLRAYIVKIKDNMIVDSVPDGYDIFNRYGYLDSVQIGKWPVRKYHDGKFHLKRDSIISSYELVIEELKGEKIWDDRPYRKRIFWYDTLGNIVKTKEWSTGTYLVYYEMTYNEKNQIIRTIRYDRNIFIKKWTWAAEFTYDEKGNMTGKYGIDKENNRTGGTRYYYDYWVE